MSAFDITTLQEAISKNNLKWRQHALTRMMERGINREEVKKCILSGEIIERYLCDYPFPSVLITGKAATRNLHIVVSYDNDNTICYVITVYEPDNKHFKEDMKTRQEHHEE